MGGVIKFIKDVDQRNF